MKSFLLVLALSSTVVAAPQNIHVKTADGTVCDGTVEECKQKLKGHMGSGGGVSGEEPNQSTGELHPDGWFCPCDVSCPNGAKCCGPCGQCLKFCQLPSE